MNTSCPVFFRIFLLAFVLVFLPFSVWAASPDGAGPWADAVVSSSQGNMKNGLSVPSIRSTPASALGIAENNTTEGNFYSLGFGGSLVVSFDNTQSGGVVVVEATNPSYPQEKAAVEISENGTTWFSAGTLSTDGEVSVPANICAKYVKITDVSNAPDFSDDTADGYDVDGIKLTGNACKPKGSTVDVSVIHSNICAVTQSNTLQVNTKQKSKAKTGKNIVKNTTGGKANITTGDANSVQNTMVTAGSNLIQQNGCCESCGSSTTILIEGNG